MREVVRISEVSSGISSLKVLCVEVLYISVNSEISHKKYERDGAIIRITTNDIFDMAINAMCKKFPEILNREDVIFEGEISVAGDIVVNNHGKYTGVVEFVLKIESKNLHVSEMKIYGWQEL